MRHGADAITAVQFPEKMRLDGVEIPLKYRFEPGHLLDGVTATVPLALLNQLNPAQTDWLVPGMLREKLTHLIKVLPKTYRRGLRAGAGVCHAVFSQHDCRHHAHQAALGRIHTACPA